MFIALSDVDDRPASATYVSAPPPGSPAWLSQVVGGMLNCEGGNLGGVVDGTSNTFLCIEDASRSILSVSRFGAYSSRVSPVDPPADPIDGLSGGGSRSQTAAACLLGRTRMRARTASRVRATQFCPGLRIAKVNQYKKPIGGPAECLWSINNCGPNDEPFAFHPGGVNAVIGRRLRAFRCGNDRRIVIKFMVGTADGRSSTRLTSLDGDRGRMLSPGRQRSGPFLCACPDRCPHSPRLIRCRVPASVRSGAAVFVPVSQLPFKAPGGGCPCSCSWSWWKEWIRAASQPYCLTGLVARPVGKYSSGGGGPVCRADNGGHDRSRTAVPTRLSCTSPGCSRSGDTDFETTRPAPPGAGRVERETASISSTRPIGYRWHRRTSTRRVAGR